MVALRRGFKTWCENAARGYRRELKLSPVAPLDPRVLAEHLGVTIWTPAEIPDLNSKDVHHLTVVARESWSAATIRVGDESLIIINSGHARTRQNNSLAHEIGHIVLRHESAKMYITPDGLMMMSEYNPIHKEEATWFAGAVLVPRDRITRRRCAWSDRWCRRRLFWGQQRGFQMRRNRTGVDIRLSRRRGTWAP